MPRNKFLEQTYCSPKNLTFNILYNETYFVSNISCPNATFCLGTQSAPFDSLMKSFNQIHNIDLAGQYIYQYIEIYLIGTPHYIMNSEFTNNQSARFFRRMNATIKIEPWFCENGIIAGCLFRSSNITPDVIFKTFIFSFEIHNILTINNVNFYGYDIVLNTSSGLSCYFNKVICCDQVSLNMLSSQNICGLSGRSLSVLLKNATFQINALFNLRLLYDDIQNGTQNYTFTIPIPNLNFVNVTFNYFYSLNQTSGWRNLITFGTLGYQINLTNVTFSNIFFVYGIFYFTMIQEDPFFAYLTSNNLAALLLKYPLSNLYNSSVIFNGLTLMNFNQYSFSLTGTVLNLMNFYSDQNQNTNYIFNNVTIMNIQMSNTIYIFAFTTNSSATPSFVFQNIIITNYTNPLLMQISGCNVLIETLSFINNTNSSTSLNLFSFSMTGSIIFTNCIFMNSNFPLYFLISSGFNITFQSSIFNFTNNLAFSLTTGSFFLLDSQILNSKMGTTFMTSNLMTINIENSSFFNIISSSPSVSFFAFNSGTASFSQVILSNISCSYYYFFACASNNSAIFTNVSILNSINASFYFSTSTFFFINSSMINVFYGYYSLVFYNSIAYIQNVGFTNITNLTQYVKETYLYFYETSFFNISNTFAKNTFLRVLGIVGQGLSMNKTMMNFFQNPYFSLTNASTIFESLSFLNSFTLGNLIYVYNLTSFILNNSYFSNATYLLSIIDAIISWIFVQNCTFFNSTEINNLFYSTDTYLSFSNLRFFEINLGQSGIFCYFTVNVLPVTYEIYNLLILNVQFNASYFLYLNSNLPLAQFNFSNILIKNDPSMHSIITTKFIFLNLEFGAFQTFYVSNATFKDVDAFSFIIAWYDFLWIYVQNISTINSYNMIRHVLEIQLSTPLNSPATFLNIYVENNTMSLSVGYYFSYFENFENLIMKNCTFINIIFLSVDHLALLYFNNLPELLIDECSFEIPITTYDQVILFDCHFENEAILTNNIFRSNSLTTEAVYIQECFSVFFANNILFDSRKTQSAYLGGAVYFLSSSDFNYSVFVLNNYFASNIGNMYGAVSVSGFYSVFIENNTFFNSQSIEGAVLSVLYSNNIIVNNIFTNQSIAVQGSVIFAYNIGENLTVQNIYAFNSTAQYGGCIYLINVNYSYIKSIYSFNSIGLLSGGVFYVEDSGNTNLQEIYTEDSFSETGGVFFLTSSNCSIINIKISSATANSSGGGFYITGQSTFIFIQNTIMDNCLAFFEGGALTSSNIINLTIENVQIISSIIDFTYGMGIFYLMGYYANDENESINRLFYLKNIYFSDNVGEGSCIFYSSNSKLVVTEFFVHNLTGSALFLESDLTGIVEITDFYINESNYYLFVNPTMSDELKNSALMTFQTIIVNISGFIAENNANDYDFIDFLNGNCTIITSSFLNFSCIDDSSTPFFFYFYFASISIDLTILINPESQQQGFIMSEYTTLVINQSHFLNAVVNRDTLFDLENSIINISWSLFQSLGANSGVLMALLSNLSINNCSFEKNLNYNDLSDDTTIIDINFLGDVNGFSFISIISSRFDCIESGNSLFVQNTFDIQIINSEFIATIIEISLDNSLRALYIDSSINFIANNCSFKNFASSYGGAIMLYNDNIEQSINTLFSNCFFLNNSAYFGGVFYIMGDIYLIILSCEFNNNKALTLQDSNPKIINSGKGGCLIVDCEYYSNCTVVLSSSIFINNYAEVIGPTIVLKTISIPNLNNENIFSNNSDSISFTDSITGTPVKVYILSANTTLETFLNSSDPSNSNRTNSLLTSFGTNELTIASGQQFNFTVLLTDQYNQALIFDLDASAKLTCNYFSQMVLIDKGETSSNSGFLNFLNVQLTFFPDVTLSCQISVSYDSSIFFQSLSQNLDSNNNLINSLIEPLKIYIRNCSIGEIFQEDKSCYRCTPSTFSVKEPMTANPPLSCILCPQNAVCLGGDQIYPKSGSWRASVNSSLILICPIEESCLGSTEMLLMGLYEDPDLITGKCDPKYFGIFCYSCNKGYGRLDDDSNCELCSGQAWTYVKISIGLVFIGFYVYVQATVFATMKIDNPNLAIFLRLFLNHFQILAMITLEDLGWTTDFDVFFTFQQYFSCLYQDFFNIDCLVQEINENLLAQKIVFIVLLPIILSLVMALVWMINFVLTVLKNRITKVQKFSTFISEKMGISLLAIIFILYPEILRKCFLLLNCLVIDNSANFQVLKYSPDVVCWGKEHLLWVLAIACPGILVWGVLTPLIISLALYKYRFQIRRFVLELKEKTVDKYNNNEKIETNLIFIDMEPLIAAQILPGVSFPLSNESLFKNNNQKIKKIIKVDQKSKETIIRDCLNHKNINLNFNANQNKSFLLKDPKLLFEYLSFVTNIKMNALNEMDLETNLVHVQVQINFEIKQKERKSRNQMFLVKKHIASITSFGKTNFAEKESVVFMNLGFIYKGYQEDYYFWEVVLFSRKFILIFIGVFTEFSTTSSRNINLVLILMVYMYLQIACQPYQMNFFNKIETISLIVATLTCYTGIILVADSMKCASIYLLVFIFALNFYYLSVWFYFFLKFANLKEIFTKKAKSLKKISEVLKKINCLWRCLKRKNN